MLERYHVAVPTAFNLDESLNCQLTLDHIERLYKSGVKSVMLCGTTGEQHSMNIEEKLLLLDSINKSYLVDSMEIIFGVSSVRLKDAITLATAISDSKIKGILLGFPPYILPTQSEAINYANLIIEVAQKETILYNNPKRTGFDLSIESIKELLNNKKVVGIKEAGDFKKILSFKEISKEFCFYVGGEVGLEEKIKFGFTGLSSILGNIDHTSVSGYFELLLKNMENNILKYNIDELRNKIFTETTLVTLKKVMEERGDFIGICRAPLGLRS